MSESLCRTWLRHLPEDVPGDCRNSADVAVFELKTVCEALNLPLPRIDLVPEMGEGYEIHCNGTETVISGGKTGVLYGAYACAEAAALREKPVEGVQQPFYALRMIDCWDNIDGSIERGYSGRSLWFEDGDLTWDERRMRQLARMLASVGINVICVNNVNVTIEASRLITEKLPDLVRLADLFRPFGVKIMVSIDFSQPMRYGLSTADPLDESVQSWWRDRTEKIYAAIPDFAGFLVKADSEHRPGPFTYGRSHADGANMLARALAPFGGALVWRCFVYNCQQDWRDAHTDRPMAAYQTYMPLDGQFDDNVILQVKNGPYDFQVREPVSPTLLAMNRTNLALEVQLAQEYTGQQIDIYAMNPMWKELSEELPPENVMAVAAVSNLGRDECYTGHPFAAVNLYGFGKYAWNPRVEPETVVRHWVRLTYSLPSNQEETLIQLLISSRRIYEKYTANLGLGWLVRPSTHYGPCPGGYEYDVWGTYHRANRNAVGIDRTSGGTGYVLQYSEEIRSKYDTPEKCPDNLLLFFHRLRYDYVMRDGRTLIQRLYDDHFEGVAEVEEMAKVLKTLELPEPDKSEAARRMALQLKNAREWRDVLNTFFHRLSGAEDEKARKIYD